MNSDSFAKIVENFVDDKLYEAPISLYGIDEELSDYLLENKIDLEGASTLYSCHSFIENVEGIEVSIKNESGIHINMNLRDYITGIPDQNLRSIICAVLSNENVSFGPVDIDDSLEDGIMPNEWIYHNEMDMESINSMS